MNGNSQLQEIQQPNENIQENLNGNSQSQEIQQLNEYKSSQNIQQNLNTNIQSEEIQQNSNENISETISEPIDFNTYSKVNSMNEPNTVQNTPNAPIQNTLSSYNTVNQQKIPIKPEPLVMMKNDRKLDNINTLNNMVTINKRNIVPTQMGGDILDLKQHIMRILS